MKRFLYLLMACLLVTASVNVSFAGSSSLIDNGSKTNNENVKKEISKTPVNPSVETAGFDIGEKCGFVKPHRISTMKKFSLSEYAAKEGLKKKFATGCYLSESARNTAFNTAKTQIRQTAFAVVSEQTSDERGGIPGGDGFLYCYSIEYWI